MTRTVSLRLSAALLVLTTVGAVSCVDPSESSFPVTIRNDTSATVELHQCGNSCGDVVDTVTLRPGAGVPANADAEGATQWWVVFKHGHEIGCLRFRFTRRERNAVVPVSSLSASCRGRP
jgi:hypothetical protein